MNMARFPLECASVTCREVLSISWRFRSTLILVLTPLLLSPLLIYVDDTAAKCAYAILIMAVYWVTEVLPLAVTALLPMVLFPILGVVDSKRVCSIYLKDTNMVCVSGLILATAVEKWNLHRRIALRVLLSVGSKPEWLMFGFMVSTAFLSMWMSNTATTAMMVPIAHAVVVELLEKKRELNKGSAGDELLRTNKPDPDDSENKNGFTNLEEIELKDPKKQDRPLRETDEEKKIGALGILTDTTSEKDTKFVKGITICIAYAANIGGTATLTGTGSNLVISGQIDSMYGREASIDFGSWFVYAFPGMLTCLFFAWIWLQFVYLDLRRTIRGWFIQCANGHIQRCCSCKCPCGSRRRAAHKAEDPVSGVIRKQYKQLGPMTWAEKAVLGNFVLLVLLWLARDPKFAPGWVSAFIPGYVSDATAGVFVCVLLFCFPSRPPNFGCLRFRTDDSVAGPRQALLDWHTVNTKLPWNVVILLGGGFALADACKVSGLSEWLGTQLVVLAVIPPAAIVFIITVIIAIFTEITSNVSTASIFLPILGQLGTTLGVHPFYFMVPAAVACSFAFMLPVATPPNAIVFAYGTLSIADMASAGAMMNIICILVVNLSINTIGWWHFDLGTFPDWALDTGIPSATTAASINCTEYLRAFLNSTSTDINAENMTSQYFLANPVNATLAYDILS
ncbi:Na(+)/citrate cotransporter-like [Saccoglossus kowalevskii]|uniref:Solute carrier family 13 member 5-like n=1 Tax=Saccoglossus kowalevskii TaxID=10224 RepID=A0ABM0GMP5_SACKO|nr:PREDICTED: solute carrier family 13 member 5-like [Saccoglossus kowalevskii]